LLKTKEVRFLFPPYGDAQLTRGRRHGEKLGHLPYIGGMVLRSSRGRPLKMRLLLSSIRVRLAVDGTF
jgi:hypothetical protein